jgi:restriction system protein
MAMMSYSGVVGRPGSYYVRVNDLFDAKGRHPGEAVSPELSWNSPTATGSSEATETTAPSSLADPSTKIGDVPTINPKTTPSPVAAAGTSIDNIEANTNSTRPFNAAPTKSTAGDPSDASAGVWVPALALILFGGALGGFMALRRRQGRSEKYAPALEIALEEVRAQASALRAAKADSMQPDRYGTMHSDGWDREKALFVRSRLSPRLRDAGYLGVLPALMPAVDTEIERQANSFVEPSPFDPDMAPAYANSVAAQEIDLDLSVFATRCAALLRDAGWTAESGTSGADKGIDILAERDGRKLLLQCKGGGSPIGVEAVQQVFTLKDRRQADVAAIVTHAPFTRAARQMAAANGVHALHDDGLMQLIQ